MVLNQEGETRVSLGRLIQFTKSCAIASILSGSSSSSKVNPNLSHINERRPPLSGLSSKGPHPLGRSEPKGARLMLIPVVLNQEGVTRVSLGRLIQFTKSCPVHKELAIASILSGSSSRSNSMIESQSKSLGATSIQKGDLL